MSGTRAIRTDAAPAPVGPYSQAVQVGDLVFCSGQIPLDPATGELETGGVEAQAKLALENLKAVVEAAGGSMHQVVRTTIFLKDMGDFARVNEVYGTFFAEPFPARACVEVARLPKDVDVEIDAIVALT